MPTFWGVSILIFAVLATIVGGFIFFLIIFLGKEKRRGKPSFGLFAGDQPGSLGYWVDWDPKDFVAQFYRVRVLRVSPSHAVKESQFTFTLDPAQKEPYSQVVLLPTMFRELLDGSESDVLITFEVRSTDEFSVFHNFTLPKIRRIYQGKAVWGKSGRRMALKNRLEPATTDLPVINSLSYLELQEYKKKIDRIEAEARAKAEKKKQPPAKPAPKATQPDKEKKEEDKGVEKKAVKNETV